MTPRLVGTVLMLALTFACGVGVGTVTTPQHVDRLIHCSIEHAPGHTPCPPPIGVEVWAVWEGGVRTIAVWDGRKWTLGQAILGSRTTTIHPIAWVEL